MEELFCDEKKMENMILISHREGVSQFFFDFGNRRILPVCHQRIHGIRGLTNCSDRIYCRVQGNTSEILELDNELRTINRIGFNSIGALASGKGFLFAGAESSLISLTTNLEEIHCFPLFEGEPGSRPKEKNAHDILIYKDIAYILDNVETPVYLFKVLVENNGTLSLIDDLEIIDAYAHLEGQWINPEWDQWMVLQSTRHRAGENQFVFDFGTGYLDKDLRYSLFSKTCAGMTESGGDETEGFPILGVTSFPPVWGVTSRKNGETTSYGLIGLFSDPETVFWSDEPWSIPELTTEQTSHKKFLLKQSACKLILAPAEGDKLAILDVENEPELEAFFDLSAYGVSGITDFLLL